MNDGTTTAPLALVALGVTACTSTAGGISENTQCAVIADEAKASDRQTDRKLQMAIFNTAQHLDDTQAAKGEPRIMPPQIDEGFGWFMIEVLDSCQKQPTQTLYDATVPVYAECQAFAQSRRPKVPAGTK